MIVHHFPVTHQELQAYSTAYGWPLSKSNAKALLQTNRYREIRKEESRNPKQFKKGWKHWLGQLIREIHRTEEPLPRPEAKHGRVFASTFEATTIYEVGYHGVLISKSDFDTCVRELEERRANLEWNEVL